MRSKKLFFNNTCKIFLASKRTKEFATISHNERITTGVESNHPHKILKLVSTRPFSSTFKTKQNKWYTLVGRSSSSNLHGDRTRNLRIVMVRQGATSTYVPPMRQLRYISNSVEHGKHVGIMKCSPLLVQWDEYNCYGCNKAKTEWERKIKEKTQALKGLIHTEFYTIRRILHDWHHCGQTFHRLTSSQPTNFSCWTKQDTSDKRRGKIHLIQQNILPERY